MDLLVFLSRDSPRVKYIFRHIFHDILGLNISFTQEKNLFIKSNIPKINYSKQPFSDELFFNSSDFLFKNNIEREDLVVSTYNNVKIFFLCNDSALPFDPFAASFYMLSRYEEYLTHNKDQIGRFDVGDSLAFKNDFLTHPVVDYWILFIKEALLSRFPSLSFKKHQFQFINTIDVDNAYAYLEKGFVRTLSAFLKDIIGLKFESFRKRLGVLFFNKKDPYDTYKQLLSIHNKYNLKTIFFFLLGNYGLYDRNVSYKSVKLKKQVREISNYCDIGLHSSMGSIIKPRQTMVEIKRLEYLIRKKVVINRQHFLFLNIPFNYRNLINAGIEHDYSMGFPSHPGFRAGTSFPFYFFDLEKNITTNLLVHSFSVMDVSLSHYLKLNPTNSLQLIKKIISRIKDVNGTFISIWHNESLNYENQWRDWRFIYEDMIRYVIDERI